MQSITSDYYYTQPLNLRGIQVLPFYNKINCPMYAPIIKDGACRFCSQSSINHRKYFKYSEFARKIQKCFFKFKFKKFYKNNFDRFLLLNHKAKPYFAVIFLYKMKYYRKWPKFNLESFIRNYQ